MTYISSTRRASISLAIATLAVSIGGCAISTPFQWPGLKGPPGTPGQEAVVSITHVVVKPGQNAAFFRETMAVHAGISKTPGIVGYSVRRELFGNQGWTVSVWQDEESLRRFVFTPQHMKAMAIGEPLLEASHFYRLKVPYSSLPLDWGQALELMKQEPRR
jgi:heme-degrading monooxygenase HmoA